MSGKLAPEARTHIPPAIWSLYGQEPSLEANDLSEILNFCLLSLKREGTDYTQYGDMSAEMARRLDSCLLQQVSWEGRIEQLKTRQYTYTRISRALLHIVLGLTAARVQSYKEAGRAPYARILGIRRESRELLAMANKKPPFPRLSQPPLPWVEGLSCFCGPCRQDPAVPDAPDSQLYFLTR